MNDSTVIAFPTRPQPAAAVDISGFDGWHRWAECEIAILGYDMRGGSSFDFPVSGSTYDWYEAFERGLSPQAAASEAAALFASA
jgi:hypothetical protein